MVFFNCSYIHFHKGILMLKGIKPFISEGSFLKRSQNPSPTWKLMLQCVCVTIHVSCLDLLNTSTPEQCSLAQADPTPVQDPTRSFLSTLHPHDIYPWHGLNLLEHLCLEKITSFECTISLSPIFFLIYNNDPGCITHPFSLTISYGLNPL